MARKHVATGKKPPGGKRPGAGRPRGSKNALPLGAVKAIKVARLRVPESASEAEAALADRCQQRLIDVMEGKVGRGAPAVLAASSRLRDEVCGPVKQRHEHSFAGMTDEQLEARYRELVAKGTATATAVVAPEPEGGAT